MERGARLRGVGLSPVRDPAGVCPQEAAVISCPSGAPLVAPGLCRSTLDLLRQQALAGVCGRRV